MNADRFLRHAAHTAPAVVLQASYANGVGIARDLGVRGVPCACLDPDPRALGTFSRYAFAICCPDPVDDEEGFLAALEEFGRTLPQKGVMFPTHDEYVWAVARNASRLEAYFHIPFSRWDVMQAVADKEQQLRAAQRVDVAVPITAYVSTAEDAAEAARTVPFPAIFKPSERTALGRRLHLRFLRLETAEDLLAAWERAGEYGKVLVQEIVPGGDDQLYTLGSYLDARSRPLAVFTGRKLRQHPPSLGEARLAESVWVDEVAEAGLRLLVELDYHGVSQVEFKLDRRDNRYKLMEVNARHWSWHTLATASGVDLTYAAYCDAIGRPFITRRQVDGRRWIHGLKDTIDSTLEISRGQLSPLTWLGSLRGVRADGLFSLRDPLPGAVNAYRTLRRIARRRLAAGARDKTGT